LSYFTIKLTSLFIATLVGVWHLRTPSVPEWLKITSELSAAVTTNNTSTATHHSALQASLDWNLPHYRAKYLLDLIEKLLQSPSSAEESAREQLEAEFRQAVAELLTTNLQTPAILLSVLHQPQSSPYKLLLRIPYRHLGQFLFAVNS